MRKYLALLILIQFAVLPQTNAGVIGKIRSSCEQYLRISIVGSKNELLASANGASVGAAAIGTYANLLLTGYPIPTYLPKVNFENSGLGQKYNRVRRLYQWSIPIYLAVFLAAHPQVMKFAVDAFTTTSGELADYQDNNFTLQAEKARLWEDWRQAFFDMEGRWPDPVRYPQDRAEWDRESHRIASLKEEDIKFKYEK